MFVSSRTQNLLTEHNYETHLRHKKVDFDDYPYTKAHVDRYVKCNNLFIFEGSTLETGVRNAEILQWDIVSVRSYF